MLRRQSNTSVFLWILQNFWEYFFRTPTNSFWISSGCHDIVLTHFFRMFLFHPLKTSQNQKFSDVVSIQKGTFERNGLRHNFPGHFENTLHSLEKLPRLNKGLWIFFVLFDIFWPILSYGGTVASSIVDYKLFAPFSFFTGNFEQLFVSKDEMSVSRNIFIQLFLKKSFFFYISNSWSSKQSMM